MRGISTSYLNCTNALAMTNSDSQRGVAKSRHVRFPPGGVACTPESGTFVGRGVLTMETPDFAVNFCEMWHGNIVPERRLSRSQDSLKATMQYSPTSRGYFLE